MPAAASGQDVQDAIEQPAGVTPRSTDVWLRRRKIFPENRPEIIVNFPEGHTPEYYLRGLIDLGRPHHKHDQFLECDTCLQRQWV